MGLRASMKKYLIIVILFCANSYAWGVIGHRVVGKIAQNHLNENTAKQVNDITGGLSLADISTWADDIKSDPDQRYKQFRVWHYIESPKNNMKHSKDNVITGISKATKVLKEKNGATQEEKFEALALLVHLVGDIHQPLHVYDDHRGANNCYVNWFSPRFKTNLHRVWDSMLINNLRLSYTEYAELLDHVSPEEILKMQSTGAPTWANESKALHSSIYPKAPDKVKYSYCYTGKKYTKLPTLSYKYLYNNRKILDDRLRKAGVRLAGILNKIFV